MGRQTWEHVSGTRPFGRYGGAEIGLSIGARDPVARTALRPALREPDPVMPLNARIALALGIALLVVAAILAVTAGHATGHLIRVPGTVVRIVQDSDAMRAYRPIVAYVADNGERREIAGSTASIVPAYDIGEHVDVLLDPAHPNRPATIDDFAQRWFPACAAALLAVASFAIGSLLYVNARRHAARDTMPGAAARQRALQRWDVAVVLIPIAIGTGFLAGAGATGLRQWQTVRHYAYATGRVIAFADSTHAGHGASASSRCAALVAFTADDGRRITFRQRTPIAHSRLQAGESVTVLYDPVMPERAIVDRFWDRWGITAILFAIGAPFLAAGLFVAATLWPGQPPYERAH